jgi:hypothetical protein
LNLSLKSINISFMGLVLIVFNTRLYKVNSLQHHDVVFNLLCLLLFPIKIIQWVFKVLSWWFKFQFALTNRSLYISNIDQSIPIIHLLLVLNFISMTSNTTRSLHILASFSTRSRPHTTIMSSVLFNWTGHTIISFSRPWSRTRVPSRSNRSKRPSWSATFHFSCINVCHGYKISCTISMWRFIPNFQNFKNQIIIFSLCFSLTILITFECFGS